MPPLAALQLLTPNALTVLFPAWARAVANRAEQGLDVVGQRLLFVGGQLLVTLLALMPPALGALATFVPADLVAGPVVAARRGRTRPAHSLRMKVTPMVRGRSVSAVSRRLVPTALGTLKL